MLYPPRTRLARVARGRSPISPVLEASEKLPGRSVCALPPRVRDHLLGIVRDNRAGHQGPGDGQMHVNESAVDGAALAQGFECQSVAEKTVSQAAPLLGNV